MILVPAGSEVADINQETRDKYVKGATLLPRPGGAS